jgi:hypothetical protein
MSKLQRRLIATTIGVMLSASVLAQTIWILHRNP